MMVFHWGERGSGRGARRTADPAHWGGPAATGVTAWSSVDGGRATRHRILPSFAGPPLLRIRASALVEPLLPDRRDGLHQAGPASLRSPRPRRCFLCLSSLASSALR